METLVILAAAAAIVLVLALVSAMQVRARRPPLRTGREDELAQIGEDPLDAVLRRAQGSPIDRMGPIHDLDPIDGSRARIEQQDEHWQEQDGRSDGAGPGRRQRR